MFVFSSYCFIVFCSSRCVGETNYEICYCKTDINDWHPQAKKQNGHPQDFGMSDFKNVLIIFLPCLYLHFLVSCYQICVVSGHSILLLYLSSLVRERQNFGDLRQVLIWLNCSSMVIDFPLFFLPAFDIKYNIRVLLINLKGNYRYLNESIKV